MEVVVVFMLVMAVIGIATAGVDYARRRGKKQKTNKERMPTGGIPWHAVKKFALAVLCITVLFAGSFAYMEHFGGKGRRAAVSACVALATAQGLDIEWRLNERMQTVGRVWSFRYFDGRANADGYSEDYECRAYHHRGEGWTAEISRE
ncbi:hypothetical protein A6D6_02631 [Alcanivorax xiamenensis]|uniref:Uncharacterized protein n=1 Tax=Alcanivorax xiamenensis TaxID=1177156 RepID=A0ABQ6Y7C1_9GAMM|nr:hypothetical protein [Alcanivorax xiamenensis]KAF0804999.1 hypothetical protein A6D6_02631 [Alcanivorax xiamenensis]